MDPLQRCPQEKCFPLNPTGTGVEGKEWTFPLLSVAAAPPLLPPRTLLASQNLPQQWSKIPFNHDLASGAEILRAFVLGRVEDWVTLLRCLLEVLSGILHLSCGDPLSFSGEEGGETHAKGADPFHYPLSASCPPPPLLLDRLALGSFAFPASKLVSAPWLV